MSGICGIFNLDGAPVRDEALARMTAMLERRGPDGTGRWSEGPVGLGHTLLRTTPEQVAQPYRHVETGCVITADARLDNREELLPALRLNGRREEVGDAELISLAYLKWGESCVDRLLGDFAFAISDPRVQRLFCARDHSGMRPFYYHFSSSRRFVFASDARAILALPDVPYQLNKGRIADFLVPELEWIDYTSTFFEDVYRLPPGHRLSITPAGLTVNEYWSPAPGPIPGLLSDQDWAEGLLDVLTRAVEARLRAPPDSICSMLSGGVDSGSIVAIGKEIMAARNRGPLPTISAARRDDPECAESKGIMAAIGMPGIAPALLYLDTVAGVADQLAFGNEEPFDGETAILKYVYREARAQGCRVVLDGAGGDVALAHGSYVMRLIRKGQVRLAVREIVALSRFWEDPSPVTDLALHARAALVPEFIKQQLRPFRQRRDDRACLRRSLISPKFAADVCIEERFGRMREILAADRKSELAVERVGAFRPNMTAGRERYARVAASVATEARDPFMDKRVIEYSVHLPGKLRLRDGWPKWILRDVMADRLPDEVRWCRGKPHLGFRFNAAVSMAAYKRGDLGLEQLQKDLQGYVDPAALADAWRQFLDGTDAEPVHTAYVLSNWLREHADRSVVSARRFG